MVDEEKTPQSTTEVNADYDHDAGAGTVTPTTAACWTPSAERALIRKLDLRIFPTFILLFILNFIDRNNFANARLHNLESDLGLTDVQYDTCISILLAGYVALQIPSNMLLHSIPRPRLYLCGCVAVWGIISACTGVVRNATGAILCRFFLGCVEAAFFPGSLYFLARWYTRREMQLRVTLLNAGNLAAQAFGGLIAAGILSHNMDGKRGVAAWRWLFIIEGVLTVFFAGLACLILPDYPATTSWLTSEERAMAVDRLMLDHGVTGAQASDSQSNITSLQGFILAIRDPKVWLLGFTYFLTIFGLSFSVFFPTIIKGLGYTSTKTLLLTAPPWIFAILISLPNAWHADRTGERFLHYFWPALTCILGYVIVMATTSIAGRYVAAFLMTTGYASGFVMLAWISNTITSPPAKKAVAMALVNAMGNIGTIPGSYLWPAKWGPFYRNSFGIEIAILGSGCVLALGLRTYLKAQNRRLDREEGAEGMVVRAGENAHEVEEESGVRGRKRFRYLY